MEPLIINVHKKEYQNPDAAEKLIRYITRTRAEDNENNPKTRELLLWGTHTGYYYRKPVEEIICEYMFIQQRTRINECMMCHYVIRLFPELFQCMNNNLYALADYAVECCNFLYTMGHQTCFAIHHSKDEGLHIHLAINTTNFINGHKLRQYYKEIKHTIEQPLRVLMQKYLYQTTTFTDPFTM